MKIAISSKGTTLKDNTHLHFGRCDYFVIYDMESGETKAIENSGLTSSQGAGIAAAQQVIDENVEVVISGKLGPNAYKIIDGEGIKILLENEEKTVEAAIDDYKNNRLESQNESGMAHAGMK